jgi:hypothetical protein
MNTFLGWNEDTKKKTFVVDKKDLKKSPGGTKTILREIGIKTMRRQKKYKRNFELYQR